MHAVLSQPVGRRQQPMIILGTLNTDMLAAKPRPWYMLRAQVGTYRVAMSSLRGYCPLLSTSPSPCDSQGPGYPSTTTQHAVV